MSDSTPSDLANAFRSFGRRTTEATGRATGSTVRALAAKVDQEIAAAASVLGVSGDGTAVAAAIDGRKPKEWDDTTLDQLRAHATATGTTLRELEAAANAEVGDSGDGSGTW